MSRQDANTAFALTSFLYGGNAAYIEDLHAKYEADPRRWMPEWQSFFQSLKDDPASVTKSAEGASWKKPGWPADRQWRTRRRTRWQLGRNRKAIGDKIKGKAQTARRRTLDDRCAAGHA